MPKPNVLKFIDDWNQRVHTYVGLFLLLFVWLYAISGLVLNHPKWEFTSFWPQRQETTREAVVQMASGGTDLARARDVMRQLGVSGEIDQITAKPERFAFRANKPGKIADVSVDMVGGKASVKEMTVNAWGVLNALHHLTGVHADNPALTRNRAATTVWSVSLDAVCIGLLLLVAGGVWIWYRGKELRVAGAAALLLGLVTCGFFLFAL